MRRALIYLHGFLSQPASPKGLALQRLASERRVGWAAPNLNCTPDEALARIKSALAAFPDTKVTLIGSSLGGFYAQCVARELGLRCVLINPAVSPWRHVSQFVGEFEAADGSKVDVRPEYGDALKTVVSTKPINASETLVVLSLADEVLDWHEANAYFHACPQIFLEGETHAIRAFDSIAPRIVDFALETT